MAASGRQSTRHRPPRNWLDPRRLRFWAVVVLAACVAAGFLVLPGVIRSAAVAFVEDELDATLEIAAIRTNPFTLAVDVDGVRLLDADGRQRARLAHLHATLSPLSPFHGVWTFTSVRLVDVRLEHAAGADVLTIDRARAGGLRYLPRERALDIDTLSIQKPHLSTGLDAAGRATLPGLVSALAGSRERAAGPPPNLRLGSLRIRGLGVDLVDHRTAPPAPLRLRDIDIAADDFRPATGAAQPLYIDGRFAAGGGFSLDASVVLHPEFHLMAGLEVEGLPLALVQPYLRHYGAADIVAGSLHLGGDIETGPGQPLAYTGRVDIDDLRVTESGTADTVLAWRQLYTERLALSLGRGRIETAEVTLLQPAVRFEIHADRSNSIDRLLCRTGIATTAPLAGAIDPPGVILGGFRIRDGTLDLVDHSPPRPFAIRIRDLDGQISRLASASAQAAGIELEGRSGVHDPVRISGRLGAREPLRQAELDIELPPRAAADGHDAALDAAIRRALTEFITATTASPARRCRQ